MTRILASHSSVYQVSRGCIDRITTVTCPFKIGKLSVPSSSLTTDVSSRLDYEDSRDVPTPKQHFASTANTGEEADDIRAP